MNTYHPTKEFDIIEKAYHLAVEAHKDQKRKSGEPYIIHPLKVAYILAELELDKETITAGILHDTIEDTPYTYEDIVELFSEEVAILVDGVTKLGKLSYSTKEEMQAENYRKMFMAMAKDIRVILIKLADRLHNMRTLNYMTEAKQREKAQETLDIYAPLAHRLGISKIRTEMEDLCFQYLNPDAYYDLKEKIERKQIEREDFVKSIVNDLKQKMEQSGINGKVVGRSKHFFSIYKKMVNQNKTLDQIYDLFAVRAIVDTVRDCYGVLGVVHTMYTPMPGRFKDYIAMPKPNMYQSLHNTLIGPEGEPFEVQIRTWDMHRTSEYGIAAHWKYKEGGKNGTNKKGDSEQAKLTWLRQILEWQKDMSDNKEYLDTIKLDLNIFNDQVYAFTPQGKVVSLPKGSTTIDFAYMIHSAIGNKMVGARVNNKMVSIEYKIQNGDRIEILTSQNSKGPSRDWLNTVKSSQARTKINQWFKKEFKEENILKGRELIDKDMKKKNYVPSELLKTEWIQIVLNKFGFRDWDALCAAVGHGGVKEGQVTNRLAEEYLREKKKQEDENTLLDTFNSNIVQKLERYKSKSGVVVKGIGDVAVRFSKCCNPVPGDEIVGFVTRGRGVTIHRTDCINVMNLTEEDRNRLIEAEWDVEGKGMANVSYLAGIRIVGTDRVGLMMEVSKVFTDEDVSVKSLTIKTTKNTAIFDVAIEVKGKEQLEKIIKRLMKLNDILEIERVAN
ncbi:bifunctional (p)ppGpp synthetase/guanosine-3',5'-bis(diphosphate) 3'-pyrophosphohydrolase [Clostridium sp. MD294]|nr:bifunctional (p)ppGpp synthetase/guanosine-3',5'-bis(diphosphate) 3'-pyrophosphohydrolase [Clostridium sp. MD294]NDO46189.1 bifunctional (p)ppGpp synthetase/guanosine-3',5'-bis(diphosphate) 3'-pyrophosphohydrolase [Clostridium sp. MD294]